MCTWRILVRGGVRLALVLYCESYYTGLLSLQMAVAYSHRHLNLHRHPCWHWYGLAPSCCCSNGRCDRRPSTRRRQDLLDSECRRTKLSGYLPYGSVCSTSNPADRGSVGVPMRPMLKLTLEFWRAISEWPILNYGVQTIESRHMRTLLMMKRLSHACPKWY